LERSVTVREQLASLVRTWVPIGVGFLLALLGRETSIVLDEASGAALTSGVAALASAAYYVIIRLLESSVPAVGWLLGLAVAPSYSKPVQGEVVSSKTEPVEPGSTSDPTVPKWDEPGTL
jgi:hypothetical protein